MKKSYLTVAVAFCIAWGVTSPAHSQNKDKSPPAVQATTTAPAEPFNRYFIGSSAFMVMNTILNPSPGFYQLNA
ncbi:MAG TPA: hypothetical protein PKW28_16985, partial [Turneriella sp.]|nr:hypothetical protein [Turneriella sp.]